MIKFAERLGVKTVPVVGVVPYYAATIWDLANGNKDYISGSNVSEGLVVRALDGSRHPVPGRKIAKFVSDDYILRKNGTEHN